MAAAPWNCSWACSKIPCRVGDEPQLGKEKPGRIGSLASLAADSPSSRSSRARVRSLFHCASIAITPSDVAMPERVVQLTRVLEPLTSELPARRDVLEHTCQVLRRFHAWHRSRVAAAGLAARARSSQLSPSCGERRMNQKRLRLTASCSVQLVIAVVDGRLGARRTRSDSPARVARAAPASSTPRDARSVSSARARYHSACRRRTRAMSLASSAFSCANSRIVSSISSRPSSPMRFNRLGSRGRPSHRDQRRMTCSAASSGEASGENRQPVEDGLAPSSSKS